MVLSPSRHGPQQVAQGWRAFSYGPLARDVYRLPFVMTRQDSHRRSIFWKTPPEPAGSNVDVHLRDPIIIF